MSLPLRQLLCLCNVLFTYHLGDVFIVVYLFAWAGLCKLSYLFSMDTLHCGVIDNRCLSNHCNVLYKILRVA